MPRLPALSTPSPQALLWASIAVALLTILLKMLAWWWSNSVALLSDALESLVNLASAVFGLMMVTIAARPPDEDHPYGHSKAEFFSSGFEGILIIAAAVAMIWASADRLLSPQPLQEVGLGLAFSLISSGLNGFLAWVMFRAAKVHRSIALHADAKHLMTDVWTSLAVVVGIVGVALTGWLWLDAAAAIVVALNILREGAHLVWRSSQGLMDEALSSEDQQTIAQLLERFVREQANPDTLRFDHISTRTSGQYKFVDLHMHMPAHWTLAQAAHLRLHVEKTLRQHIPGLCATIQMLPSNVEAHWADPQDNTGIRG